ncbi:MAG: hypothetical protein Q7S69_08435 [Nitrosomonadaceae bacterium]|nr:hypothetical protein [Nitrosomonadaceae bacterium]
MPSPTNLTTAQKIWGVLTSTEQRNAVMLLGLMLIGMVLETLGIGLTIPALALLTQSDLAHNCPAPQALGNPSQQTLVIGGMLVLVGAYLIKALFLAFLAWQQTRLAFGVQTQLSQRLFTVHLRQTYTFCLQDNSAQLIHNVTNEASLFIGNGILHTEFNLATL